MTGGSLASARATATRWRWPPDKLIGTFVHVLAKAERAEQVAPARSHRAFDNFAQRPHRQHDVFQNGEFRQQEMKLKDKAEHGQPRESAILFRHLRGGLARDQHLARCRQVEQAEQIQQRRLARAGRAGDGDEFVLANGQIDAVHQRRRHDARQNAGDVARLDQRRVAALSLRPLMSRPG